MLKFYGKKSCITCQKAKAFLDGEGIAFEEIPIETQPPTLNILETLVEADNLKASLNSRSAIYKANNLGQAMPDKNTILALMRKDPNLIKRPVILTEAGKIYQGFDEKSLKQFLNQQ